MPFHITGTSEILWKSPYSSPLITFKLTVDPDISLISIYGCIHEIGKGKDGIKTEQLIECTGDDLSLTLDTSKISQKNGFQIFGFRQSSTGEKEPVVGLIGNSTDLRRTSTLHLGIPTSGQFPILSL